MDRLEAIEPHTLAGIREGAVHVHRTTDMFAGIAYILTRCVNRPDLICVQEAVDTRLQAEIEQMLLAPPIARVTRILGCRKATSHVSCAPPWSHPGAM